MSLLMFHFDGGADMIKILLIGICVCWVIMFLGPVIIKAVRSKSKKGDSDDKI